MDFGGNTVLGRLGRGSIAYEFGAAPIYSVHENKLPLLPPLERS
jgi:hypothetical protein